MFWIYFIPLMSVAAVLLPYLIFYLGWPQQVAKLKIHAKTPGWGIMRREIAYSALSVVVFALVGWGLDGLVQAGYTQLFEKISGWGWLYLPLALSLAFLLHDAYFYWSHRLMHWGWLYRVAHCWHHRFHTPTPFTAFAFHPIEAVIQILIVPLVAVLIPMPTGMLVFFTSFLLLMSVYGHLGFELRANKAAALRIFNTAIHHHQHHQYVRFNFGIYFNFWDRVMGTNHATYPQAYLDFGERLKREHSEELSLNQKD